MRLPLGALGVAAKHREYNIANDDDIVAQLIEQHRQQQQQESEPADPAATAAAVLLADEDADLVPNEELMRVVKDVSPCAAVRKRQDVMDRDEYAKLMRMTNADCIYERPTATHTRTALLAFHGP